MLRSCLISAGCLALMMGGNAHAQGFQAKPAQEAASGFFLDVGGQLRLATRNGRNNAPSFRTLPYAGIGYGDVFSVDTQDGGWLELGRAGSFGFGPAITLDRHLTTPAKNQGRVTDIFGTARTGAFMRYIDGSDEWGRLTVTSGLLNTTTYQGIDIRATKRFGITDSLSLNLGPTLSFGDSKRYGATYQLQNPNRLAATGAALQIEKELGRNLTATIAANYSYVHAVPNSSAPTALARNRFDIGLTLSTRLIGQ